jgi:hypothetical protein
MENKHYVRFEILTASATKSTIFWDVTPCSLVEVYKCSRQTHCLILRAKQHVEERKKKNK